MGHTKRTALSLLGPVTIDTEENDTSWCDSKRKCPYYKTESVDSACFFMQSFNLKQLCIVHSTFDSLDDCAICFVRVTRLLFSLWLNILIPISSGD